MLTPPEQFGIVEPGLYRSDTLHPSHFPFIRSLNLKTAILLTPELPSRAMSNFFDENHIRLIDLGLGTWKHGAASSSAGVPTLSSAATTITAASGSSSSSSTAVQAGSAATSAITQGGGNGSSGAGTTKTTGGSSSLSSAAAANADERDLTTATSEHRRLAGGIPPTAPAFQTSLWKPLSEELIKDGLELILDAKNYPIIVMDTSGIHEIGTFMGCLRRLQHWNFSSIIVEYRAYAGNKARYVNEQFIELFDVDWITLPKDLPEWWLEQEAMWHEEEEENEREMERERQNLLEGSGAVLDYPQRLS